MTLRGAKRNGGVSERGTDGFIHRFEEQRQAAGVSKAALCRAAEIGPEQYRRYVTGRNVPTPRLRARLRAALRQLT